MTDRTFQVVENVADASELVAILRRQLANPAMESVHMTRAGVAMLLGVLERVPPSVWDDASAPQEAIEARLPLAPCGDALCAQVRAVALACEWVARAVHHVSPKDYKRSQALGDEIASVVDGQPSMQGLCAVAEVMLATTHAYLGMAHPAEFAIPGDPHA